MAEQKFRSALNGFNREDVVHYIGYMNTKHAAELNQLQSENQSLLDELNALKEAAEAENLASRVAELEARCMELEQLNLNAETVLEEEQQKREEAMLQISKLQETVVQITAQRDEALAAQASAKSLTAEELEAYRRAERTERDAKERAEQIYLQATGTLAEATTHVDEAAERFRGIAERINQQMNELQCAIESSKNALTDAATTMYAIRPKKMDE